MNHILAVCDSEVEYTCQLAEYLNHQKGFPFQVQLFTSTETLRQFTNKQPLAVALISEEDYEEELKELPIDHLILLGEGKEKGEESLKTLYKYQSSQSLTRELLEWVAREGVIGRPQMGGPGLKMIAIYSPIGRCLKTSFSFVLGQVLGKKHKVLYLNMESYSGLGQLLQKDFSNDMSELIYYLQNTKEKFAYRMSSMIEQVGGVDILPPFDSFLDFTSVSKEEWIQLFQEIEKGSEYEYLILDLSDAIQGLFDILRLCDVVYTIDREDGFSKAKINQYEEVLRKSDYEDVWKKTKRISLPHIQNLPSGLLRLTYTELAEYAKDRVQEDLNER